MWSGFSKVIFNLGTSKMKLGNVSNFSQFINLGTSKMKLENTFPTFPNFPLVLSGISEYETVLLLQNCHKSCVIIPPPTCFTQKVRQPGGGEAEGGGHQTRGGVPDQPYTGSGLQTGQSSGITKLRAIPTRRFMTTPVVFFMGRLLV